MPLDPLTLLSAAGALIAVLGLVLLAGRAAKVSGFRLGTSQRLTVRDSLMLDRTRALRIVVCDGRELLLLTGGSHDLVVGWLPPGSP